MTVMSNGRIINRYSAYYAGWCTAFGEHQIAYDQQRDIQWVFGEDKAGIILPAHPRLLFIRELLGKQAGVPEVTLGPASARINQLEYPFEDPQDQEGMRKFRAFIDCRDPIHMFLSSHFCYPPGTRIVTFSKKKPLPIMYKEIEPLRLLLV